MVVTLTWNRTKFKRLDYFRDRCPSGSVVVRFWEEVQDRGSGGAKSSGGKKLCLKLRFIFMCTETLHIETRKGTFFRAGKVRFCVFVLEKKRL